MKEQKPERGRAQPNGPAIGIGARQRQGPRERERRLSGAETTGMPATEPGSGRAIGEARVGRERPARDDSRAAGHHTRPALGDSGPPEERLGEGESDAGSVAPDGDAAR